MYSISRSAVAGNIYTFRGLSVFYSTNSRDFHEFISLAFRKAPHNHILSTILEINVFEHFLIPNVFFTPMFILNKTIQNWCTSGFAGCQH